MLLVLLLCYLTVATGDSAALRPVRAAGLAWREVQQTPGSGVCRSAANVLPKRKELPLRVRNNHSFL